MDQSEPLSQVGEPAHDVAEPMQAMPMDDMPTMEGRGNLRVFLVMLALAVCIFSPNVQEAMVN